MELIRSETPSARSVSEERAGDERTARGSTEAEGEDDTRCETDMQTKDAGCKQTPFVEIPLNQANTYTCKLKVSAFLFNGGPYE